MMSLVASFVWFWRTNTPKRHHSAAWLCLPGLDPGIFKYTNILLLHSVGFCQFLLKQYTNLSEKIHHIHLIISSVWSRLILKSTVSYDKVVSLLEQEFIIQPWWRYELIILLHHLTELINTSTLWELVLHTKRKFFHTHTHTSTAVFPVGYCFLCISSGKGRIHIGSIGMLGMECETFLGNISEMASCNDTQTCTDM